MRGRRFRSTATPADAARRLAAAVAFVVITLLTANAAAEPPAPEADLAPWRVLSPSTLTTEKGSTLELPPGVYVLTAEAWAALDAEVMRLQEAEVRLAAENRSLRASAQPPMPGWGTLVAVVSALAAGYAAARYAR